LFEHAFDPGRGYGSPQAAPVRADGRDPSTAVRGGIDRNRDNRAVEAEARERVVEAVAPPPNSAECQREVVEAGQALRRGRKQHHSAPRRRERRHRRQ
jgi:hypothetical protein